MSQIEKLAKKDFNELWKGIPLINKVGLFKNTVWNFYIAGYSRGAIRGLELAEK